MLICVGVTSKTMDCISESWCGYVEHREDLLSRASALCQSKRQTDRQTDRQSYQLKVDVGVLNTVKSYWADVSSVNPSSDLFCSDEGFKTSAQFFSQLKVHVGMLNTVKIYWADMSSVNPSSGLKGSLKKALAKSQCSKSQLSFSHNPAQSRISRQP